MRATIVLLSLAMATAGTGAAQQRRFPPESLINLKVFDQTTPVTVGPSGSTPIPRRASASPVSGSLSPKP